MNKQLPTPHSDPNAPLCRLSLRPGPHKNQCHCQQHLTNSVRTRPCLQFPYSPHTGPQLEWLSALPPQCRNHLIDCGHHIAEPLHGSSHSKQAITHCTRKVHFLSWYHAVGLHDPCTPELPLQGCNWIIACYAVSVIRGHTITGMRIRHSMLQGYVKQALRLHTDRGMINPRLADVNYIKIMTNAVRKYESVPKCKETISNSMFHYIAKLALRSSEDSLIHDTTSLPLR